MLKEDEIEFNEEKYNGVKIKVNTTYNIIMKYELNR